MDPNACLRRLDDAITNGDLDEADYAATDLWDWLRNKGFPPDGLTRDSAFHLVQAATRALKDCGSDPSAVLNCWVIAKDATGVKLGDEETPNRGM